MEEFWVFQFEIGMQGYDRESIAAVADYPQPRIPDIWLEPAGPTCDMCSQSGAQRHHTGELLCQNCVDIHYSGCW